jgi:hypothetical protein
MQSLGGTTESLMLIINVTRKGVCALLYIQSVPVRPQVACLLEGLLMDYEVRI